MEEKCSKCQHHNGSECLNHSGCRFLAKNDAEELNKKPPTCYNCKEYHGSDYCFCKKTSMRVVKNRPVCSYFQEREIHHIARYVERKKIDWEKYKVQIFRMYEMGMSVTAMSKVLCINRETLDSYLQRTYGKKARKKSDPLKMYHDQIMNFIENGWTYIRIAEKLGCRPDSLGKYIRKLGIRKNSPRQNKD